MPRALITGITGQDGWYLSEYLLSKGYDVYGLIRGQANPKRPTIERELPDVKIVDGDILDQASLINVVQKVKPDEVYNLAAISFVALSWNQPELTGEITGLGALRMLEAIRLATGATRSRSKSGNGIRFYQASSSEMFGKVRETPQNEQTPFYPRSPYGVAKAYAHYITVNYRESYGIHACSGILFNHGSPRRGPEFVERKITLAAARIKLGLQKELLLGNLEPRRDWGFAGDYVRAMHLMLQQPRPDDYVIGTGETHQIKEVADIAFKHLGLNWKDYVRSDPQFMRPAEVDLLIADASKARKKLKWKPSITFEQLIHMMVESDLAAESKVAAAATS
ncbi:MAG TPA: GDP-mannose 4,6-dehydratase [Dehalococcoidia bacterium]|nr:GDP-mannose 4,6-dehydratase [Dehalococcoidia bacterium]